MIIWHGERISDGIAIGPIYAYSTPEHQVERTSIEDVQAECKRFEEARKVAYEQLQSLIEAATEQVGTDFALVFEMHQMIVSDVGFVKNVEAIIQKEGVCAEYAVSVECARQEELFLSMNDDCLCARCADVRDVTERIIRILTGERRRAPRLTEASIILATELKPSQTIQLERGMVAGLVTGSGSENSHMSILARTMGIPAIICERVTPESINPLRGKLAILDGNSGTLILDPDEGILARMQRLQEEEHNQMEGLRKLRGLPDVTKDGRSLHIYANIGGTADLEKVLENDASGIGLVRSEFLFLEAEVEPSEEEQFRAYQTILKAMKNKPVIIRTLDLGADKLPEYMERLTENNPSLGCRGVRLCLHYPKMFKTQLRAILRAGIYGNAQMMLPMIASMEELRQVKRLICEVQAELTLEKLPWRSLPVGVMIETPAAALISDELAKEADFFSIGTNDLTQYTLAMDRQNVELERFLDPHHPAVLRLIEQTVMNGHKAGIPVAICGELGADESLLEYFVSIGIDEISVPSNKILQLRGRLRQI